MPDGTLADSNGNAVLDTTGKPIQIPPTDTQVTVAGDGSVSTENGPVGKIGVVQPSDVMKLERKALPISLRTRLPRRCQRLQSFRAR
jgi:flagellar basal body rod protein FlgG